MAKVSPVTLCRYCKTPLSDPNLPRCRECGRRLREQRSSFESPHYITKQLFTLLTKDKEHLSAEESKKRRIDLAEERASWFRSCPPVDRLNALRDAHLAMTHVMHADIVQAADISEVVKIGKDIGRLAEAVDNYFKAGGASAYVTEYTPPRTNDEKEGL